jgi:hypothetical protein
MRFSIITKLVVSYLIVAGLVVGPTLWFLRTSLLTALETSEARELKPRIEALRARLSEVPDGELDSAVHSYAQLLQLRITVIDRDGVVRADSDRSPSELSQMENHAGRSEVKGALQTGYGYAVRTSATTGEEYVYAAIPMQTSGPPRGVLRVARVVSSLRKSVSNALFTVRLSTGIAVTAALLLSLGAAIFISLPLRRMRDAATAFARAEWVPFASVKTGDELEALSLALVDLGEKMRTRLAAAGISESMVRQVVQAAPIPALLLDQSFSVLEASGTLRASTGLSPDGEAAAFAPILQDSRVQLARSEAERQGNPIELKAPLLGKPDEHRPALLVPLTRAAGSPYWLLLLDLGTNRDDEADARVRSVVAVDKLLDALWSSNRAGRREIALLRGALDEIVRHSTPLDPSGVEPQQIEAVVSSVLEEVGSMKPEQRERISFEAPASALPPVVDSAGLLTRAVRSVIRLSLEGSGSGSRPAALIQASVAAGDDEVYLSLSGGPSIDLGRVRTFSDPLGAQIEWHPTEQLVRLTWPRA